MTDQPHLPEPTDGDWLLGPLAQLPTPAIPADVSDRVVAAIRAEAAARAAAAPADLAQVRDQRRARRSSARWWAAAAGVAAVGLGALVYVETMPTASEAGSVVAESAIDRAAPTTPQVVPVSSGADYSVQNIATIVPTTITTAKTAATKEMLRATFAETEAGISSCLAGVGNPPQDLALLDLARFQDSPVAVLAYLDGNDDGTADVVVVGVRCSREDPQVRHRDIADMTP